MNRVNVCPICLLNDRIEKVSAIRSAETRTGEFVEMTDLAKSLSPPPEPIAPVKRTSGCQSFGVVLVIIMIVGWLAQLILYQNNSIENQSSICGFIIFAAAGIYAIYVYLNRPAEYRRELEQYEIDYPRWKDALDKWNKAYYCRRNDAVFIPDGNWVYREPVEDIWYRL